MKFQFKKASRIDKKKAKVYGGHLRKLANQLGTALSPADVLADAKTKASPLHEYFEWDNSVAAEKYRIVQASYLLRQLEVHITIEGESKISRAFVSLDVNIEDQNETRYIPIDVVLKSQSLRTQMVMRALTDLEIWQKRYQQLEELVEIVSAIENTKKKLHKPSHNISREAHT